MASSDEELEDDDDDADEAFQSIRIPLGHPPVLFGLPGGWAQASACISRRTLPQWANIHQTQREHALELEPSSPTKSKDVLKTCIIISCR